MNPKRSTAAVSPSCAAPGLSGKKQSCWRRIFPRRPTGYLIHPLPLKRSRKAFSPCAAYPRRLCRQTQHQIPQQRKPSFSLYQKQEHPKPLKIPPAAYASRSAAVIFVALIAIICSEVQRTVTLYLPVRCTSVLMFFNGLQMLPPRCGYHTIGPGT